MIQHHVYWALVGPAGSMRRILRGRPISSSAPANLRDKLREDAEFRVAENYLLSGLGRHAPDDHVELAVVSLLALSVELGDQPYLNGDNPCGTDATALGVLAGVLTPFFVSVLRDRASSSQSDCLCRPLRRQYYPEFACTPLRQAA